MSIHGILGETTSYPKTYNPSILYPIARQLGRDEIQSNAPDFDIENLSLGMDWWHAFEVSWLNPQGVSQVAIARFSIPADTPNIVESKSLKLYLNSLNFTEFASWQAVQQTIKTDLSACVGGQITVQLFRIDDAGLAELAIAYPQGQCIDHVLDGLDHKLPLTTEPDASWLSSNSILTNIVAYQSDNAHYHVHSNLLRSNCPVTDQPDWGALEIDMHCNESIERQPLDGNVLCYILSFRQHNGFHEQCVEQIYADLWQTFEPISLMVRAWYTRRGGIDINPCRVSDLSLLPSASRLIRQ